MFLIILQNKVLKFFLWLLINIITLLYKLSILISNDFSNNSNYTSTLALLKHKIKISIFYVDIHSYFNSFYKAYESASFISSFVYLDTQISIKGFNDIVLP